MDTPVQTAAEYVAERAYLNAMNDLLMQDEDPSYNEDGYYDNVEPPPDQYEPGYGF